MSDASNGQNGGEGKGDEGAKGADGAQQKQGGDAGKGGEQQKQGDDQQKKQGDGKADPRKPEWMSDRIWTEKFSKTEGDLNMGDVAKFYAESYDNATTQLHSRKDVIKGEIEQELKAAQRKGAPDKANDYVFNQALADSLGLSVDMAEDNPHLVQMKNWAFEKGLSQKDFDQISQMHLEAVTSFFPNWDEEQKLLGDNGVERAAHLNTWLSKVLSPKSYKAMERMALSADSVIALEELQELSGVVSFTKSSEYSGDGMAKADIMKLMDTPEYRKGDPATLQKVQAGFRKLAKSA